MKILITLLFASGAMLLLGGCHYGEYNVGYRSYRPAYHGRPYYRAPGYYRYPYSGRGDYYGPDGYYAPSPRYRTYRY